MIVIVGVGVPMNVQTLSNLHTWELNLYFSNLAIKKQYIHVTEDTLEVNTSILLLRYLIKKYETWIPLSLVEYTCTGESEAVSDSTHLEAPWGWE